MNNEINEKLLRVACQSQITNCSFELQYGFYSRDMETYTYMLWQIEHHLAYLN